MTQHIGYKNTVDIRFDHASRGGRGRAWNEEASALALPDSAYEREWRGAGSWEREHVPEPTELSPRAMVLEAFKRSRELRSRELVEQTGLGLGRVRLLLTELVKAGELLKLKKGLYRAK